MRTAIVTTTINVPTLLEYYIQDALAFGHREVSFIIVADRKTPVAAKEFCNDLGGRYPYEILFLGVDDQERYLSSYPELAIHLPYDSIQRRNIGILMAYQRGADLVITIDDDNFLAEPDFVRRHMLVGQTLEIETYNSPSGWINVCDFVTEERGFRFYHRGFPLEARSLSPDGHPTVSTLKGRVVANAGFWLASRI